MKICHKFIQQRDFKNVAHAVRNSKMFMLWSKSFNIGYDAQAKINVFFPFDTALE